MFSPRIRRTRERLACAECRRRKLRCDRNSPCSSCVRRGDSPSCSYAVAAGGLEHERDHRVQAEDRLAHLEQLVQHLAAQNVPHSAGNADATGLSSASTTSAGTLDGGHSIGTHMNGELGDPAYIGASHWSAMLDDIQALRSAVYSNGADDVGLEPTLSEQATTPIAMLFGVQASTTISIDNILRRHAQQFRRQYQAFWTSPSTTPVLWISILFSIFHVATNALRTAHESFGVVNQYSVAAAHCLVLGEYFRPRRFAVEALLIYVQSYCLTSLELAPELGPICSVLRSRDSQLQSFRKGNASSHWSMCMQLDLLTSFHLGLPSSVQYSTWDTRPPSSLLDSEFDEDTVSLPTPLPQTELGGMPFYIAKHHLMVVFEKILRHVLTVRPDLVVDDEVMALDEEVRRVCAALPGILHRRPMSECLVEPPSLIVTRLCVSFLYNKCICVLHRLYVTRGREESIRECYAAASDIVQDFLDAQKECKPGGVLEGEHWFMTNITWHDFLLGVTSLCMVMCATSQGGTNRDTARVLSVISATIHRFGEHDREKHLQLKDNEQRPPESAADDVATADEIYWPWTENMAGTFDDPNWAYLDRFLDLPSHGA
ncbi:hypothetical protein CONLIGDRAFT_653950 [Coniochaeta ligniaria NRRL 30616]|uniref:Zn(2)-C6 fungal-type domain-containing protein n=1 Tax=Coniochaeta ligniaria NRRL 30616 TaxID=1408157 RepID=A0A1J7IQ55_9PEZI|nr:hypothetical protein CONLIGDRAFT_653950 [Coniochaeta ligniaria NRRL 30616]